MKKFISMALIALSLSFNIVMAEPESPSKPLTEGVYNADSIGVKLDEITQVQNVSDKGVTYFIIYDEADTIVQSIKLIPNSPKVQLYPKLNPNYKIIVVGDGSIVLS